MTIAEKELIPIILTISTFTPLQEGLATSQRSTVHLEDSLEDISETGSIEAFINNTCGCKIGPKSSPCSKLITKDTIVKFRNENMELSNDELDLFILAQVGLMARTHGNRKRLPKNAFGMEETSLVVTFVNFIKMSLIHPLVTFRRA